MKTKKEKKYDILTKGLFPFLRRLIKLILNIDIDEKFLKEKSLSINLPKFIEKRPDILFEYKNTIYHIEFQIQDEFMLNRMFLYSALIFSTFKKFPTQIVIYLGERDLKKMKNVLKAEGIDYNYKIVALKDIDGKELLKSENIEDWIIAILCKIENKKEILEKIINKLKSLSPTKRIRYIEALLFLSNLRKETRKYFEKFGGIKMPLAIDPLEISYIRRWAEEAAKRLAEKLAEEKAKKLAEEKAKKLVEEKAKKLAEKKVKEKIKTLVINMYKTGIDIDLISKSTNIPKRTIKLWLKKEGLI